MGKNVLLLVMIMSFILLQEARGALYRPATNTAVSSSTNGAAAPEFAFDIDTGSRWESAHSDNQWIYVNLGSDYIINSMTLDWETAHSANYSIRIRTAAQGPDNNPANWTEIASVVGRSGVNGGSGAADDSFNFNTGSFTALSGSATSSSVSSNISGCYVMIYGTTRATIWGHSLYNVTFDIVFDHNWISIATNKATASSQEDAVRAPEFGVDDNAGTRWSTVAADNQWIYVDLLTNYSINAIHLDWEAAHSSAYTLRVRTSAQGPDNDPANWTEIASVSGRSGVNGGGGTADDQFNFDTQQYTPVAGSASSSSISLEPMGRYVMLYGTTRATGYGHSIYEMDIMVTEYTLLSGAIFLVQ